MEDLHVQVNGRPESSLGRDNALHPVVFTWRLDSGSTVARAVTAAQQRLRNVGAESPRLDAEILLSHVLRVERVALYTHPERALTDAERSEFENLIERRRRHEPVAYLIGSRSFFGLDFAVDSRVLIPRPETELLVEHALSGLGRLASRALDGRENLAHLPHLLRVADVGTGCGTIAVSIAATHPDVHVSAIDISHDALAVARTNVDRHGLAGRVSLLHGDLLKPLTQPVDVITANLPYVHTHEIDRLAPDIAHYEPRLALDGGADGGALIARLLSDAPGHLRPGGLLLLEIGADQGSLVTAEARRWFPHAHISIAHDLAGLDRVVRIQTH